ncbi:hypothetical protein DRQ33_00005, partial [bacterium]
LQVYPDGECENCMSSAIYNYMDDGFPSLNFKIYLMPISEFNVSAVTDSSFLLVQFIDSAGAIYEPETLQFYFFDVVMFGVSDCYASHSLSTSYDLTPTSANAVREFVLAGKGILLTHDTAINHTGCYGGGYHTNFLSLSEITGLTAVDASIGSSGGLFTSVHRVFTGAHSIFNIPFEIPDSFSTISTHALGQRLVAGDILYSGDTGADDSICIYWQNYHNLELNTFSSFFSYGHTATVPAEWEAKAMINSIYYSYHGGIGSGVYTSEAIEFSSSGMLMVNWSADVPTGASINIEVAIDTCLGTEECWTEWFTPSAVPEIAFDKLKYRVGMSPNADDESPILHWIQFATGATSADTIFADGILDTRPPTVSAECPPDTVQYGDTISLDWEIDDLFPNSDEPCSIFVNYCEGMDTFLSTEPMVWTPLPVVCESAYVAISAPDSFCNWGYDTCRFTILAAGSIRVAFPETSALACDTIDIPIDIVDMYLPLAQEFTIWFSINSSVATPLEFIPEITPPADSVEFGGAGNYWYIKFLWDSRVYFENDIFGNLRLAINCSSIGGDFTPLHFDSISTDLMETYWDNGLIAIEYNPAQWIQVLRFDDPSEEKPRATLGFGNATDASDGYDPAYDIIYVPPPPTDIGVWFALDDPAITRLKRDVKDMEPINTWTVINTESRELYVHWDPRGFDEGLYLLNGYQDMNADTDYYSEPYETLIITWSLPDWERTTINLYPGWNLVSIPVRNPSGSPESIFPGILFGPLGYNAMTRGYYLASRVAGGAGYWVFSLDETEIPIIGLPMENYSRNVFRGWNLVGATIIPTPVDSTEISPAGSILSTFKYNTGTRSYDIADTFNPGLGYWIFVTNDGILWVPIE